MTTQHTSGPWITADPKFSLCAYRIEASDTRLVGFVAERTSNSETQANARLIAAAPELLQALEAIEAILDGRQPKDVPGAVMVARAAIAKAKGQ